MEDHDAPKYKSQCLIKIEKVESNRKKTHTGQSEEAKRAPTLIAMQSSSGGKEKRSKGKEKMNPYSKPAIQSLKKNPKQLMSQASTCLQQIHEDIGMELPRVSPTQGN